MLDIDLCAASDVYKINLISEDVDFEKSYNLVEEALEKMYWYDRKVFEIINGGESIAELSRKSKIEYFALYFTHKKVKDQLKKLI